MEHRYTERKQMAINVVVSCARFGLVRGRTVDIGCGGMFVETDCIVMPLNAPVTVSFDPSGAGGLACVQVKAMVVHQRAGGFGLMFDDLEPACRELLRGLLGNQVTTPVYAPAPRRVANG